METIIATNSPLKGKCFSCIETSVNLSPCVSSLNALSSCCLYGKVVTLTVVEEPTVVDFVAKVWKKHVSVLSMVDDSKTSNVFRFGFDSSEDRNWALRNGPWCIRGYTLVLQAWTLATDGPVVFHLMRVWIQLHNLPHEYFFISNGNLLGGLVGKVVNVDLEEDKPVLWDDFLHVQVDIDLNNPLVSGFFFDLAAGVFSAISVVGWDINGGDVVFRRRLRLRISMALRFLCSVLSYPPPLRIVMFFPGQNRLAPVSTGDVRLSPEAMAEGVDDPSFKISNPVQRTRHTSMVTSRDKAVLGQSQRIAWIPKSRPPRVASGIASLGRGRTTEVLEVERVPEKFPFLMIKEKDRSMGGQSNLNEGTVGENGICTGPSSIGPSLVEKSGPSNLNSAEVAIVSAGGNSLGIGPVPHGPNGQAIICNNSPVFGPSLPDGTIIPSRPELLDSNGMSSHEGGNGNPRPVSCIPITIDPGHSKQRDEQVEMTTSLAPSNVPDGVHEAKVQSDEDKALSQFFHAQEKLLMISNILESLTCTRFVRLAGILGS
ncbi:hypothetical protein F8388_010771 [Cannabis sativa]|uniref:DUF4283 domain-containing protein n=1 Tax=Cannabis sativa TaxID=3483 RepID=A0A7J6HDN4_CANSA|nr:hypothetical protein F8388_010771 [Cannabis sativa]